jgi:hypothetical protein
VDNRPCLGTVTVSPEAAGRATWVAAEEHGPHDRGRAEAVTHGAERSFERFVAGALERQDELHGARILEVRDGDAGERQSAPLDRHGGGREHGWPLATCA